MPRWGRIKVLAVKIAIVFVLLPDELGRESVTGYPTYDEILTPPPTCVLVSDDFDAKTGWIMEIDLVS
jgi:hypothetical protein